MDNDLSKCEKGDYIWTIRNGWEVIEDINTSSIYRVKTEYSAYTTNGRLLRDDMHPSAFIDPPTSFNQEEKPCKLIDGDKVLVRDNKERWIRRYFAYKEEGIFYCYANGKTKWSSIGNITMIGWGKCKKWDKDCEE